MIFLMKKSKREKDTIPDIVVNSLDMASSFYHPEFNLATLFSKYYTSALNSSKESKIMMLETPHFTKLE